jgi:hypothetical protein
MGISKGQVSKLAKKRHRGRLAQKRWTRLCPHRAGVTLVSIVTPTAEKPETSGNETGNEIVSNTKALIFIEDNAGSRKRRKPSGRKRRAVFWLVFVSSPQKSPLTQFRAECLIWLTI